MFLTKMKSPKTKYAAVVFLLITALSVPLSSQFFSWHEPAPDVAETETASTISTLYEKPADYFPDGITDFNRSKEVIVIPEKVESRVYDYDLYYALSTVKPESPVFTEVNYDLYISAKQLNLRSEPSTESEIMAKLKFGEKVVCIGENEEWLKVRYNDGQGYLKAEYTSRSMVFKAVNETVYVKSNTLNLRAGPSVDEQILKRLVKNEALIRTGIGDKWSRVKTLSGIEGYVATEYLIDHPLVVIGEKLFSGAVYANLEQSEIDALTRIVALEASPRYGYNGYLAVATVILNRVESSRFPDTISAVVSQSNQFSVYNSTRTPVDSDNLRRAVSDALAGKRILPSYVMYFITPDAYERNVDKNGSFGQLKVYGIAYGTVWCYKASDKQ